MAEDEESAKQNAKVAQILAAGGLPAISRLDTCVTLVDACNVFNDYQTADFLVDRNKNGEVPEEDDRCISDLMTDQLEFADVVICSKVDLVAPTEVERIRSLVHQLNPTATFIPAVKGQIDLSKILNTGSFSYAKAATSAGWLRSLQEVVKPETEEYGVGTFVYRARRPFHPLRLWKAIREVFVVIQTEYIDDGEGSEQDEEKAIGDDAEMSEAEVEEGDEEVASDDEDEAGEAQPQLNPAARLASKKASGWANLFRSKGFIWLATRPLMVSHLQHEIIRTALVD
ncbi:Cobalamin synthesis protein [Ceraceosorus bombacis]|uniref:Cobalamin synthesis protein n=1 Tax=Ceraceosorus bombacis TaxID=401625 RepID=A0A0P1BGT5_9BASI|nr:Cobalamin synthesis protein [Ceraceosorus bombacis]